MTGAKSTAYPVNISASYKRQITAMNNNDNCNQKLLGRSNVALLSVATKRQFTSLDFLAKYMMINLKKYPY